MSCAEGGSGGRGGRRSTNRSLPRSSRKVKLEPPPSPILFAVIGPEPSPCPSRNASTFSRIKSGALVSIAPIVCLEMLRPVRRRLYLMRHAEVSYVGARDPEVVRLTERGLEQAAAAHGALEDVSFALVVTSSLPRTPETASDAAPRRGAQRRPGFDARRGATTEAVSTVRGRELVTTRS